MLIDATSPFSLSNLSRCNERKEPNNNTTSSSTQGRVFTIERKLPSSATAASQFAPRNMFKQPLFYIIAVTHLVFFYVINLYGSIAVDTILDKGIPVILAITVAPTVSVFDWVGRVLLPIASQRGYVRPSVLLTLDYFVVACGLFLIPYAYDHPTMLVTCVSFGAFSGHAITVHGSLMVDYIGSAQANLANIIITCVATAAFFTKPFVVGEYSIGKTYGKQSSLQSALSGGPLGNSALYCGDLAMAGSKETTLLHIVTTTQHTSEVSTALISGE